MLAVDNDDTYSDPRQVSVAADGTLWALYDMFSSDGAVDRLRRWNGEAWQTFDVPSSPIVPTEQFYGESPVDIAMVVTSAQQVHVFNVVEYPRDSPLTVTLGAVVHTFDAGRWRSDILSGTHSTHVNDSWGDPVSADGSWVRLFGRVLHGEGSSWQLHTLSPPDPDFPTDGTTVFSDDGAEPWAVAPGADAFDFNVLRWEGSGWREIGLPTPGLPSPRKDPEHGEITYNLWSISDVVALDADDVWAVGEVSMSNEELEGNGPTRSLALHWDGASWSCRWGLVDDHYLNHAEPDGAGGMWMTSVRHLECPPWCWRFATELLHLSEGRWTREQLSVPDGCKAEVSALVRRPASQEVYAVGSIYSPDGGEKTCRDFPDARTAIWRTG
jgi:hypothetical protein